MTIVHAFIFARGGSKGLPGKNTMALNGVSLLGHSIRTAHATGRVSKVFVSTDSPAIADEAVRYDAEVILRPDELASDTASEWAAWQHALRHLEARGEPCDVFLSLPTTAPLRSVEDVGRCLDSLADGIDIVITVTPAARSPYFNMVVVGPEGDTSLVIPAEGIRRRQDAPVVYDITTVAYVSRPSFIHAHTGLFQGRVCSVVVPKERAVDIDDAIDFDLAQVLASRKLK